MPSVLNLRKAKAEDNDEFFTLYEDIEREVMNYRDQLKNKIILCNCDNPELSNFWKFFHNNFHVLKLKKLISTHYEKCGSSYAQTYDGEKDEIIPLIKTQDKRSGSLFDMCDIESDGDFRSEECKRFLEESDIVITNPPFSLFREFITTLEKHNKKYLVLGNMNAITCKEIFPLIKDNKMWAGYDFNVYLIFKAPYVNEMEANRNFVRARGYNPDEGYMKVSSIAWFTNLNVKRRQEGIVSTKKYNEKDYPKYDNYNAIEVSKVADIPYDYDGIMGVPISFLDKYNPEQFEIIGSAMGWVKNAMTQEEKKLVGYNENTVKSGYAHINGEQCYHRIFIKRRTINEHN